MGSRFGLVAALVLAMSPAMATAQERQDGQDNAAQPVGVGALGGFRLDPARDTGRSAQPERAGPEIDNRPALPLPGEPAARQAPPPPVTRTVAPSPRPAPASPPAERTTVPRPAEPEGNAPAPVPQAHPSGDTQAERPSAAMAPEGAAAAPPAPALIANASERASAEAERRRWLAGLLGLGLLGGIVLWWRFRRRKRKGRRSRRRGHPASPGMGASGSGPTPPVPSPAAPPPAALELEFTPESARNSIIGIAVGYRLLLRNRGEVAAEHVGIAARIANAGPGEEDALVAFFAAPDEGLVHEVARIEPGGAVEFAGELRLPHEAVVPIHAGQRELLIPVIAFSAQYRWADDGRGYSAAAFIVGEESDPPRERMGPFRLDLGPRQYRSVGCRRALATLVT